ncbi:MAG: hypothetical protein MJZ76_01600 [Bacteroidales bacterium]|nr:hypothetical protein [Bacteroidales bacterium]
MKNVLYLHGFGSNKDSYTGNTLKRLFPEFNWTLETFDLVDVFSTIQQLETLIKKNKIDTVISSSLGCIYNLFLKKDESTDLIVNKVLINPCCFPSKELPRLAQLPNRTLELCKAVEFNVYECHHHNNSDNIFGIFAKNDELLHYHDFVAGRYGNYGENGQNQSSNIIWVEGGHSHLAEEVLYSAIHQAKNYFDEIEKKRHNNEKGKTHKAIVYIDMDGTLVDWESGQKSLTEMEKLQYHGYTKDIPGLFNRMDPIPGAIEAFYKLSEKFDVYVLTSAPWYNQSAPSDKMRWLQKYFGEDKNSLLYKKVILSHHKYLNEGKYLIDDKPHKNQTDRFKGELIHFGSDKFPNWEAVVNYLMQQN